MYKKETGNDKQGKDAGNRTFCPYRNLSQAIMQMYSMGACAVLGMTNQDASGEDLESNPFLNSALQRLICEPPGEFYYRFGSFLAPPSVGLITSRH